MPPSPGAINPLPLFFPSQIPFCNIRLHGILVGIPGVGILMQLPMQNPVTGECRCMIQNTPLLVIGMAFNFRQQSSRPTPPLSHAVTQKPGVDMASWYQLAGNAKARYWLVSWCEVHSQSTRNHLYDAFIFMTMTCHRWMCSMKLSIFIVKGYILSFAKVRMVLICLPSSD